jgi:hypothetical protein
VHHGQINGAFDVELVATQFQRMFKDRSQLQGLLLHRFGLAGGIHIDDGQFLAEAKTRTHQRIQLPRGMERVQTPDRA